MNMNDVDMDQLATELQGAVARIYRRVRSETPDNELGDTALSVLKHVFKNGPQTPRALSDRERVTPPAMNQTINALEAAGFVTRNPDPTDGRKVLVTATDSGVALMTEGRRARHLWLNSRLAALTDRQRQALLEATRILNDMAAS
jgi:DNA-binding MarR family transcriptional regulator